MYGLGIALCVFLNAFNSAHEMYSFKFDVIVRCQLFDDGILLLSLLYIRDVYLINIMDNKVLYL